MNCQRILTVGLLAVYLVNKIQFWLKLCSQLFDFFVNNRQNLHTCAKAAKESKLHYPPFNTTEMPSRTMKAHILEKTHQIFECSNITKFLYFWKTLIYVKKDIEKLIL